MNAGPASVPGSLWIHTLVGRKGSRLAASVGRVKGLSPREALCRSPLVVAVAL